jgi:hypothetical protein
MTFEDYIRQQGMEYRDGTLYGQNGRPANPDMLSMLAAQYEQLMRPDSSGRLPQGTELQGYANNLIGGESTAPQEQVVTVNGRQFVRVPSGSIQDLLRGSQLGSHPWIAENAQRYLQGLTDQNIEYDPRYGYGIEKSLYDQTFGRMYADAPNSGKGGFFGKNGVLEAFSSTIGPVMGLSHLVGTGLTNLAANGSTWAGGYLPEGGYQSLYSSLSGSGADAAHGVNPRFDHSYWDEAGNIVNPSGPQMFWDEAGNLVSGAGAATGAATGGALGATTAGAAGTAATGAGAATGGSGIFSTLAQNVAPLAAGAVLGAAGATAFGGGSGSAPGAPNYGDVIAGTNAASKLATDAAWDDYNFRNQFWNDSKDRRDALLRFAGQVAEQQLGLARGAESAGRDQWDMYNNTFKPVEMSTAVDSFGGQYLSDAEADQLSRILSGEAGLSTGDAQRQAYALSRTAEGRAGNQAATRAVAGNNAATAQAMRAVQRMGGDPNKFAAATADLASRQALVGADASNRAREGVRDRQAGLRMGTATFGRNLPNTALQFGALSGQIGNSAVTNAQTGANAELPFAQFRVGGAPTYLGAAALQQQGALGLGNIQSRDYAAGLNYSANTGGDDDGFGTVLGLGNLALNAYRAFR